MRLLLGLVAWVSVIYSVGMLVAFVGVARDVMSPCASTPGGCGADEAYAAEYFDGLVPFDTVLAGSRDLPADVVFDLRSPQVLFLCHCGLACRCAVRSAETQI